MLIHLPLFGPISNAYLIGLSEHVVGGMEGGIRNIAHVELVRHQQEYYDYCAQLYP